MRFMATHPHRHTYVAALLLLVSFTCLAGVDYDSAHATPPNLLSDGTFTSNANGWTSSSQTHSGCVNYPLYHQVPSPLLDGKAIWLNACGGSTDRPEISQTIMTTVSTTYLVSGYVKTVVYELSSPNTFDQFEVVEGGATLSPTFGTPTSGWSEFSASFVASSASTILVFRAESTSNHDYSVDSLSVIETAGATTNTVATTPPTTAAPAAVPPPQAAQPAPETTVQTTTTSSTPVVKAIALPISKSRLPEMGRDHAEDELAAMSLTVIGSLQIFVSRRMRHRAR